MRNANEIWNEYVNTEDGKLAIRVWKAHIMSGVFSKAYEKLGADRELAYNPFASDYGDGSGLMTRDLERIVGDEAETEEEEHSVLAELYRMMDGFEDSTKTYYAYVADRDFSRFGF